MTLLRRFRSWLRALLHRSRTERDMDAELRSHIESYAEDLVRSGLPRADALRRARLEFGGLERVKEECRESRGISFVESLAQDLSFGLRMLRKSPGFTTVAVLTLALGIGATTAIFTVIDAVLLRPLPFSDPGRVVMVYNTWAGHPGYRLSPAPADSLDWQAQNAVFTDLAIIDWDIDPVLSQEGQPVKLPGLRVSSNYFSVFAVPPLLGRTFLPGDDQPGNDSIAVLSYGLWQREFGKDPRIIGKSITLDDASYTVVGVMPPQFSYINDMSNTDWSKDVAIWMPNPFTVTPKTLRGYNWLSVVARLKPGISLAQAQSNMEGINNRIAAAFPDSNQGEGIRVVPFQSDLVRNVRLPLILLLAAVALTLLISCINVASLLLARAGSRQKEIGIRLAIGASRARLIRQLLTESTLLSLAGGVAGVFLAWWGSRALVPLSGANLPRADTIGVNASVLAFTLSVSILTGILFGMAPAVAASKPDLNQSLSGSGKGSAGSLWGRRSRGLLVVAEIAFSLVLLIGAGLAINSFVRLLHINPGFSTRNVMALQLDLVRSRYADPAGAETKGMFKGEKLWTLRRRRFTFVRDVLQRFRDLPGVESVAATDSRPPLGGSNEPADFTIEGLPKPREGETPRAVYRPVTPDYFRVMQIPLFEGRVFTNADNQQNSQPVVVIDQAVARRYFPHKDPVGQHVSTEFGDSDVVFEIVGVVGAVRESRTLVEDFSWGGLDRQPQGVMYFPYFMRQRLYPFGNGGMYFEMKVSFLARAASNPSGLAPLLQKAVWAVDKDQPIESIQTIEQVVSDSISDRYFYMLLLGIFAGIALLLALAGVYAVISYFVTERTHEIGLRIALGAGRGDVLRLVVGEGLILTLLGVAIGLAGSMALTRYLASLLFEVSPLDPATFAIVSATLATVALLASYIPARRAMRVDPMVALRYE